MSIASPHLDLDEISFDNLADESPWPEHSQNNITLRTESSVGSTLQSTPVGPAAPPLETSQLPSAIKDEKEEVIHHKKSLISRLAQKAWNSPRRSLLKINQTNDFSQNNNISPSSTDLPSPSSSLASEETTLRSEPCTSEHEEREPPNTCLCISCTKALAKDTFSNPSSEISNSMSSLPRSPARHSSETNSLEEIDEEIEQDDTLNESVTSSTKSPLQIGRNMMNSGMQQLTKFINATLPLRARRSGTASEFSGSESSTPSTKRPWNTSLSRLYAPMFNCRKKSMTDSRANIQDDLEASENPFIRYNECYNNGRSPYIGSTSSSVAEYDMLRMRIGGYYHSRRSRYQLSLVCVDPTLRSLMEELKQTVENQETIIKQSSKALDVSEFFAFQNRMPERISFVERTLLIAQRKVLASELELRRLIDGGTFETQRDVLFLTSLRFNLAQPFLEHLRTSEKYLCIVVMTNAHQVEFSDTLELDYRRPENNVNSDRVSPTKPLEFRFNRPDWRITIELFVFKQEKHRESPVSQVWNFLSPRDSVKPPADSDHVRTSKFTLSAGLNITRESIVAGAPFILENSDESKCFQSELKISGTLERNEPVFFQSYIIVKDFNGIFGLNGQMKTFYAKLANYVLEFFEVSDECNEDAKPVKRIDFETFPDCQIEDESDSGTYFHDFTLKLTPCRDSWLDLCTNSKEDSAQWISHLKVALMSPSIIHFDEEFRR